MNKRAMRVREASRALQRGSYRSPRGGSGWSIAGIVLGALVVITIAMNAKDVARYLKISAM